MYCHFGDKSGLCHLDYLLDLDEIISGLSGSDKLEKA